MDYSYYSQFIRKLCVSQFSVTSIMVPLCLFAFISLHIFIPTNVCRKRTPSFERLASQQRLRTGSVLGRHQHFRGGEDTTVELTFRGLVSSWDVCPYENNCAHITQCHNSDDHKVNFHRCEEPWRYPLGWSIQRQVRHNATLTSLYGHPFWVPPNLGMRVCMFTPPISLNSRRSCYIWCTWVRWTVMANSIKIARCSWKACWNERLWWILNKLHGAVCF